MAMDRTNMKPESIKVKRPGGMTNSMLPGDINIHEAPGAKSNTHASHYADAMSRAIGAPAGPGVPVVEP